MPSKFTPGDMVRIFAAKNGWPLASKSILVEGEHDQRYFALANELHRKEGGRNLIGSNISIFPTGIGDEGGAFGLQRHFHPLRAYMDIDLTPDSKKVFHAIAIFDNDIEGKRGFAALTGRHLNYRKWRDVFLLHREIPRHSRNPDQAEAAVLAANTQWSGLDCEIEDLVGTDLTDCFLFQNPTATNRAPIQKNGAVHYEFQKGAKSALCRFAEENAMYNDMSRIIEILKSLRYFVGLDPDGD